MVTARAKSKYKPADLLKYKGDGEHIVLSVCNLGFNKYKIMDIETEFFNEKMETESQPRFKTLEEKEIDEIAKKQSEPTTDRQTAWAVRIIKGKFTILNVCQ